MALVGTNKGSETVSIQVHQHEIAFGGASHACWTYLTAGLNQVDHRELAFTLLVDDDDNSSPPAAPVKLIKLLLGHIDNGQKFRRGQSTRLGKSGLFGFQALFFLPAVQFDELPALENSLALVLVHQDEYEVAREQGTLRLVSQIGKQGSSFPYPTWHARARPSALGDINFTGSRLSKVHTVRGDTSIVLRGNDIHLGFPRRIRAALSDSLANREPTAFLGSIPANIDGCLFWREDEPGPTALAHETSQESFALAFALFQVKPISYCRLLEDGIEINLCSAEFDILVAALNDDTSFRLDLGTNLLHAEFVSGQNAEPFPFESKVLRWDVRQPLVQLEDIVAEPGFNTEDITNYVDRVTTFLNSSMEDESESFLMTIQVAASMSEPHVHGDIELNPEFIRFLQTHLPMPLGSVGVTLKFRIRPAS